MQVGYVGAGNMARALAKGVGEPVLCTDGGSDRAERLAGELGGEAVTSNQELAKRADFVVLCHEPEQLSLVADEVAGVAKCVVSVLARTPYAELKKVFPRTPVFRVMPNLAVEVRRGVTLFASPPGGEDLDWRRVVLDHFGRVGRVLEIPEQFVDVAGAINSVGPAYVALIAEAQVDAAIRLGVPPQLAAALVTETLMGSTEFLRLRRNDTLAVRRQTATPGGSTARGLAVLEAGGLRAAFHAAMDAVLDSPGAVSR